MTTRHDPIDAALRSVRACTPTRSSADQTLERRLMRAYDARGRRLRQLRTVTAVLAVTLVLGASAVVAPAAVETIKGWLLRVEINGEPAEVEVDPSGTARLTIETDGAGPADVVIEKSNDADGHRTRVAVATDDAVAEGEVVVRSGDATPERLPSDVDLSAARTIVEWIDERGIVQQVVARPNVEGNGTEMLLLSHETLNMLEIKRLTGHAAPAFSSTQAVFRVRLDERGTLTIAAETPPDDLDIVRFHLGESTRSAAPGNLRVTVPGLDLRVPIDPLPPNEGGSNPK